MTSRQSVIGNLILSVIATGLLLVFNDAPAQAGGSFKDSYTPAPPSYLGWYLEGRIGGPVSSEFEADMVSPNVATATGTVELDADDGFGFTAGVGRYFRPRWRGEVEWVHGSADDLTIDYTKAPLNFFGGQILAANGDITVNAMMVNVLRSWNRTFFGHLRPFNGLGLGFANIDISNVAPAGSRFIVDDSDTVFTAAYHSGFDWEISDRTALTFRISTVYSEGGDYSARDTLNAGGILTLEGDSEFTTAVAGGLRIRLQ